MDFTPTHLFTLICPMSILAENYKGQEPCNLIFPLISLYSVNCRHVTDEWQSTSFNHVPNLRVPKLQNLEGKKLQIYKYIHIIHTGLCHFLCLQLLRQFLWAKNSTPDQAIKVTYNEVTIPLFHKNPLFGE